MTSVIQKGKNIHKISWPIYPQIHAHLLQIVVEHKLIFILCSVTTKDFVRVANSRIYQHSVLHPAKIFAQWSAEFRILTIYNIYYLYRDYYHHKDITTITINVLSWSVLQICDRDKLTNMFTFIKRSMNIS